MKKINLPAVIVWLVIVPAYLSIIAWIVWEIIS